MEYATINDKFCELYPDKNNIGFNPEFIPKDLQDMMKVCLNQKLDANQNLESIISLNSQF